MPSENTIKNIVLNSLERNCSDPARAGRHGRYRRPGGADLRGERQEDGTHHHQQHHQGFALVLVELGLAPM